MLKCRGQVVPRLALDTLPLKARQTKLNLNRLLAHSEHHFEVFYKERGLTTGTFKLPHDGRQDVAPYQGNELQMLEKVVTKEHVIEPADQVPVVRKVTAGITISGFE
jgi:hypothetical protein